MTTGLQWDHIVGYTARRARRWRHAFIYVRLRRMDVCLPAATDTGAIETIGQIVREERESRAWRDRRQSGWARAERDFAVFGRSRAAAGGEGGAGGGVGRGGGRARRGGL